jgi:hypothetical protein
MTFLIPKFKTDYNPYGEWLKIPDFKNKHSKILTCCFCGNLCYDLHKDSSFHSNNADCEDDNDRCCLKCNDEVVIPHRMMSMFGRS